MPNSPMPRAPSGLSRVSGWSRKYTSNAGVSALTGTRYEARLASATRGRGYTMTSLARREGIDGRKRPPTPDGWSGAGRVAAGGAQATVRVAPRMLALPPRVFPQGLGATVPYRRTAPDDRPGSGYSSPGRAPVHSAPASTDARAGRDANSFPGRDP